MRRKEALKLKRSKQARLDFDDKPKRPAPPRFSHPHGDNERLLNAQADIIEGVASGWQAFYQLAMKVAMKYVQTTIKTHPNLAHLSPDERKEKAHDAVVYIAEGYLSDDAFCIKKSMTGYLFLRVRHELFNHSKADSIVDYVDNETIEVITDKLTQ